MGLFYTGGASGTNLSHWTCSFSFTNVISQLTSTIFLYQAHKCHIKISVSIIFHFFCFCALLQWFYLRISQVLDIHCLYCDSEKVHQINRYILKKPWKYFYSNLKFLPQLMQNGNTLACVWQISYPQKFTLILVCLFSSKWSDMFFLAIP